MCAQGFAATFMSEAKAQLVVSKSAGQLSKLRIDGFDRAIAIYSNPHVPKLASVGAAEAALAEVLQGMVNGSIATRT